MVEKIGNSQNDDEDVNRGDRNIKKIQTENLTKKKADYQTDRN